MGVLQKLDRTKMTLPKDLRKKYLEKIRKDNRMQGLLFEVDIKYYTRKAFEGNDKKEKEQYKEYVRKQERGLQLCIDLDLEIEKLINDIKV